MYMTDLQYFSNLFPKSIVIKYHPTTKQLIKEISNPSITIIFGNDPYDRSLVFDCDKHYNLIFHSDQNYRQCLEWINDRSNIKIYLIPDRSFYIKNKSKIKPVDVVTSPLINVILLMRDEDRKKNVHDNIISKIPKAIINRAIDGLTDKHIIQQIVDHCQIRIKDGLRFGQIACGLSHYSLWNRLLEEDHSSFVILEDDAKVLDDFDHHLDILMSELPSDFDWVYLYVFPSHYRDDPQIRIDGKQILTKSYFTYCTIGYMISRSGARKMIDRIKDFDKPIDVMISEMDWNGYSCKYNLIENMGQKTSDRESGGLRSNIWI